ncbi:uncharacterized protein LOC110020889 [Phalaenopsis equestris]|uniref:uncharacterized protein LOC110020889 n=1 Tax=Phalaenopsis equestris TaxID=78828 RepID=UPI0009E57994|nr:uncharacterized protein LOC110020889 [Phalaenopsis equestris]XP_020574823.1 uncharacterized protein LOC110020889 [Phalaenopsis equestris]
MASQMHAKPMKFEKASKLAEMWMGSMSGSTAEENEPEFVGRIGRVGLGMKIIPNDRSTSSADPLVKKLQGKLNAFKKKSAKIYEQEKPAEENGLGDSDDDDDDEPESRIKALAKKRANPETKPLRHAKKVK